MADRNSFKKGDRVFWWTKEGRAYSSVVSGTFKRYGTIERTRGKFERLAEPWQDKRQAEVEADDAPGGVLTIGFPFLHPA